VRIEPVVVRQPLQRGIGENHVAGALGHPAGDIGQGEVDCRQALASGLQHVFGIVQAADAGRGIARGEHFGGIARAATQVDADGDFAVRQRGDQVADRARAFAFEGGILTGGPVHGCFLRE
jgi:hypothetical protein